MGRAHEVRKVAMAKTAAKKTKLYSRYGKEIYLAAKAGGPEPDANLALRRLIEKAKKEQVPADVIKRAVDKVKSGVTENYEEKVFEGYANGGATIIVKCLTDNINRTISSVRPAFTKSKAKLGNEGSVSYLYDVISVVAFKGLDEETVLDALVMAEVDAQDMELLKSLVNQQIYIKSKKQLKVLNQMLNLILMKFKHYLKIQLNLLVKTWNYSNVL